MRYCFGLLEYVRIRITRIYTKIWNRSGSIQVLLFFQWFSIMCIPNKLLCRKEQLFTHKFVVSRLFSCSKTIILTILGVSPWLLPLQEPKTSHSLLIIVTFLPALSFEVCTQVLDGLERTQDLSLARRYTALLTRAILILLAMACC